MRLELLVGLIPIGLMAGLVGLMFIDASLEWRDERRRKEKGWNSSS